MTLTWAEFVKEVEAAGVKPDTPIWYIDVSYPEPSTATQGISIHISPIDGLSIDR